MRLKSKFDEKMENNGQNSRNKKRNIPRKKTEKQNKRVHNENFNEISLFCVAADCCCFTGSMKKELSHFDDMTTISAKEKLSPHREWEREREKLRFVFRYFLYAVRVFAVQGGLCDAVFSLRSHFAEWDCNMEYNFHIMAYPVPSAQWHSVRLVASVVRSFFHLLLPGSLFFFCISLRSVVVVAIVILSWMQFIKVCVVRSPVRDVST